MKKRAGRVCPVADCGCGGPVGMPEVWGCICCSGSGASGQWSGKGRVQRGRLFFVWRRMSLVSSRLVLFDPNSTVRVGCCLPRHVSRDESAHLSLQACTTALCGIPYAGGPVADRTVFENAGAAGCGGLESGLAFGNSNTVLRRIRDRRCHCQCEASGDCGSLVGGRQRGLFMAWPAL
jgi:hypothetical protein